MNKTKVQIALIVVGALIIFQSCNLFNPDEEIPAYIKIDRFELTTNQNDQGTNSNKITDVWVNTKINDDGTEKIILQGIYELPVTFPALSLLNDEITLRAGIKRNGIAASREVYPFYKHYVIDTLPKQGDITELFPKTTYKDETIFDWMEDFEDPGLIFQATNNSDTSLIQNNKVVFEGNYSGAIYLDTENDAFECTSIDSLMLSYQNTEIYLEMNYKCNQPFTVGLQLIKLSEKINYPIIYLNPKDDWNKIHIRLTDVITSNSDAYFQKLFIRARNDTVVADSKIFIDNIKLVHF